MNGIEVQYSVMSQSVFVACTTISQCTWHNLAINVILDRCSIRNVLFYTGDFGLTSTQTQVIALLYRFELQNLSLALYPGQSNCGN